MAYTSEDLVQIDNAIKAGARRVRINGREKEYFSANDLLALRRHIVTDLGKKEAVEQGKRRPTSYRTRTAKGL